MFKILLKISQRVGLIIKSLKMNFFLRLFFLVFCVGALHFSTVTAQSVDNPCGCEGAPCAPYGFKTIKKAYFGGHYAMLCNCESFRGIPGEECLAD